jgi:hypothetical protein
MKANPPSGLLARFVGFTSTSGAFTRELDSQLSLDGTHATEELRKLMEVSTSETAKGPKDKRGLNYISFLRFPAVHPNEFLKSLTGVNFPCI